jgi:hypothetical protein
MEQEAIIGNFIIEKMEGKGGWSYIILPNAFDKSDKPFGWRIVKGMIDGYQIVQYKLWPTKYGELFLPIKSEIRKKIRKEAGDSVYVELFQDESQLIIPDEFIDCLVDVPSAKAFFESISETSQKQYIDWIYATKNKGIQAKRIAKTIEKLSIGKKYHQL